MFLGNLIAFFVAFHFPCHLSALFDHLFVFLHGVSFPCSCASKAGESASGVMVKLV